MSAEVLPAWWPIALLAAARVLPVALWSPIGGGRGSPMFVRVSWGLALTVPAALALPAGPLAAPFPMLLAKELLIGASLALGVTLFFEAVAGAGSLIDAAAGRGSPGTHATIDADHDAPTRTFAHLFALALFFSLGGGRLVVGAIANSFVVAPVGAMPDGIGSAGVVALGAAYFQSVLLLAAPAVMVLLLADLTIAAAARALPPINGFFLGLSLRPLLAVLLCGLMLLAAIEAFLPRLGPSLAPLLPAGAGR